MHTAQFSHRKLIQILHMYNRETYMCREGVGIPLLPLSVPIVKLPHQVRQPRSGDRNLGDLAEEKLK